MEIGQSACSIRRPQDCPVRAVLDGAASAALRFDGLGAVSAGGTSRYLYDYAEPIRSEILDLLFLPGYAASIQVLKVEIGGDAQSGFGVQPSHRREANETRCERGDTFWLIREARRRNPQLVLVASPWTFPPWVGVENATQTSFYNSDAIDYILSWIACANATDAGRVDFLGGRPRRSLRDLLGRRQGHVAPPVAWVWELRTALASAEVPTQLVLPDAEPDPLDPLMDANELLGAYGLHYPCFLPMPSLQEKGLPFWSTEDGGMLADWAGAACAGRSINTNLVRMNATSTLLRSLVWAVHPALPGPCDGLLDAREPWSGRYAIQDPLWILAHTTRFTQVGWHVLPLQSGASGHLKKGGTVVCYLSPDRGAFTLVVEKLQAPCQSCPGATTGAEEVVFHLAGGLESKWVDESDYPELEANATEMEVTSDDDDVSDAENASDDSENESDAENESVSENESNESNGNRSNGTSREEALILPTSGLGFFLTNKTHKFFRLPDLPVDRRDGSFSFVVQPDTIYTITSLNISEDFPNSTGHPNEAPPVSFPVPFNEDFDQYVSDETPGYFADYGGSFQVSEDPAYPPNLVLKQGIAQKAGTNAWVSAAEPMTLIGHRLDDIVMSVDVFLPDFTQLPEMPERPGIQAAWDGQCLSTGGAAFGTSPPLLQESCEVKLQQSFILETSSGRLLAVETSSPQQSCLTAHRCDLSSPYADPGVCMRPCSHDQLEMSNQTWEWHPDGSLRLQMHPNLCLTQGRDRQDRAHTAFVLADCGEPHALPTQRFLATGPMPIYTGLCVRLQPRARHEDPGDLLNGLPGRNGYCLRLGVDAMKHGTWRLESGGVRAKLLAQGPLVSPFKTWHRLRLAANGTVLRVKIDDQDEVVAIHEEHTIGATALISGWHEAFYDNVAMEPPSSLEPVYY